MHRLWRNNVRSIHASSTRTQSNCEILVANQPMKQACCCSNTADTCAEKFTLQTHQHLMGRMKYRFVTRIGLDTEEMVRRYDTSNSAQIYGGVWRVEAGWFSMPLVPTRRSSESLYLLDVVLGVHSEPRPFSFLFLVDEFGPSVTSKVLCTCSMCV